MKFILNLIIWLVYQAGFYSRLGVVRILGSDVARTAIVILAGLAVGLFIPYWIGLLVTGLMFGSDILFSTLLYWSMGVLSIVCAIAAGSVIGLIWVTVYDEVKG